MFVGHLALGFAGRRWAPRTGLAWLVAAVSFVDLLWPIALLTGLERLRIEPGATAFNPFVFESYPWTHSLAMGLVWGAVLGVVARMCGQDRRAALLIGALVVSHWVLDFASHAPDMPLWPGASSPRFGLGLWNSVPGTLGIEGAMWIVGLVVYLGARPLRGWGATIAFWSFVGLCTVMWAATPWTPPPPSARAVGWFGLIGWLTVPWAAAADRRPA